MIDGLVSTYPSLLRDSSLLCEWQGLDCFDHEVPWEVTADEADHLVVVQASYCVIVWRAVEHFPNLLEEALSVKLSSTNKSIFSQENVLTLQGCIETKTKIYRLE